MKTDFQLAAEAAGKTMAEWDALQEAHECWYQEDGTLGCASVDDETLGRIVFAPTGEMVTVYDDGSVTVWGINDNGSFLGRLRTRLVEALGGRIVT